MDCPFWLIRTKYNFNPASKKRSIWNKYHCFPSISVRIDFVMRRRSKKRAKKKITTQSERAQKASNNSQKYQITPSDGTLHYFSLLLLLSLLLFFFLYLRILLDHLFVLFKYLEDLLATYGRICRHFLYFVGWKTFERYWKKTLQELFCFLTIVSNAILCWWQLLLDYSISMQNVYFRSKRSIVGFDVYLFFRHQIPLCPSVRHILESPEISFITHLKFIVCSTIFIKFNQNRTTFNR